jgi:hypothetical protein
VDGGAQKLFEEKGFSPVKKLKRRRFLPPLLFKF